MVRFHIFNRAVTRIMYNDIYKDIKMKMEQKKKQVLIRIFYTKSQ